MEADSNDDAAPLAATTTKWEKFPHNTFEGKQRDQAQSPAETTLTCVDLLAHVSLVKCFSRPRIFTFPHFEHN